MQIMQMRRRDEIFEMKFTCPAKSYFFLPNPRPYVRYLDLLLEELLDRWRRFFQNNIFLGADKSAYAAGNNNLKIGALKRRSLGRRNLKVILLPLR